jgi:hypothetical protein
MYTTGGGGYSHTTLSKFQYIPGGQGGGGGWARLTAGEASSISGRNANTTADKALRCSQGFIGHLLSVAFCVEILRFVRCPEARFSVDRGDRPVSASDQPFDGEYATRFGQWTYRIPSYGAGGALPWDRGSSRIR